MKKDGNRKLKRTICSIMIATMLLGCCQIGNGNLIGLAGKAKTAASTYYDYAWWTAWTYRSKIRTSYESQSTTKGSYSIVAEYRNRTNRVQSYKYEYSRTKSRTIDLGATIPIKAMELELGASFLDSETTKHELSGDIPKGKTRYIKRRTITKTKKYKNRVTPEAYLILYGEWFNYEKSYTKYTELKETWLAYTADKKKN